MARFPRAPPPGPSLVLARSLVPIAFVAFAAGCPAPAGEPPPTEGEGEGDAVGETPLAFDPDHVVEIAIDMDPAEWAVLAKERRSVVDILKPGCLDAPFVSPFHDHTAAVTIDGQSFPAVHVKKRGFLGSLSDTKPSLKIDLDDFDAAASFHGLDKLTLSNSVQDPSYVHTCMAYAMFAAAGVAAPRCNFAHVVVNGDDLGLYAHVETVKKGFLERHFGDGGGNLYEGTLSDFTDEWDATFDEKLGSVPTEIEAIDAAAGAADADVVSALDQVVDLDELYTFWAVEVLLGHWDGYSGNQNNFFLYGDPSTGKAVFIPWGPDQTWLPSLTTPLQSVNASGFLTRRLYDVPEGQAAYVARLRDLLATTWDEAALDAEVDRIDALIDPYLHDDERQAQEDNLQPVRDFIAHRRRQIEDELAAGPPAWTQDFRATMCVASSGSFDATFTTTFGTFPTDDTFATGDGTFSGALDGGSVSAGVDGSGAPQVGAAAGLDPNVPDGTQTLVVSPELLVDGRVFFYVIVMPTTAFASGAFAVDDVTVQVVLIEALTDGTLQNRGRAFGGTLVMTASTTPAAPVTGTLHADLIAIGF